MVKSLVKLELSREPENEVSIAAPFDEIFVNSSNNKSLRYEVRFRDCPRHAMSTDGVSRAFSFADNADAIDFIQDGFGLEI